jgi:hypothetical protein
MALFLSPCFFRPTHHLQSATALLALSVAPDLPRILDAVLEAVQRLRLTVRITKPLV